MTQEILTGGPLLAEILELEEKVWAALIAGDPAADGRMLTGDFLGVYTSGFSDKSGHTAELEGGPSMAGCRLSAAQLRVISADAVLLSYRADYLAAGKDCWDAMYISSLWEKTPEGWLNSFSQDTPAA
jgi:hypothetical protein